MATQGKDGHGPPLAGREKKGMSQSYPWHKRSQSLNDQKHVSVTPSPNPSPFPSDQKCVPNYLRPTLRSAPHPSTNSSSKTRQTSITQIQKPATLHRRRSFDKPPSPNSRLHKTHATTPTPIPTPTPTYQKMNLQSSSSILVPKRSSSLPKPLQKEEPIHKKNSGKSHSLYARPTAMTVKKMSTDISKKQNNPSTTSATASSMISSPEDIAYMNENQLQEALESSLAPVTDQVSDWVDQESNNIELPVDDVPILEEESLKEEEEHDVMMMIHDDAEQEKNQHKDLIKSSTVSEEDQNQNLDVQMEEAEAEAELVLPPSEETNKDESNESHAEEESSAEKSAIEGHEEEEEEEGNHATKNSRDHLSTLGEKKELVDEGGICLTEPEEREASELTKPEKGKEKEYYVHRSQGKAYNEVIEETASKLIVEKRKNKVKALVGAFETVISLQDQQHPTEGT
ncbi:eukaryotic initiation factor 4F subunit p150-like [Actinidia eriantha]|uniref:eukaryotic initiation factor 4F subunit p150-like n=1 Tax=Actinidia eriantha TaxID=165200 RepID=UPI0025830699|nr:eukaryotic initiation factor 4F subunit p150-like [Actinidia eriantha]